MGFYVDMSSVLDSFKVDLTIYPVTEGQGDYVNGHWIPNDAAPFKVSEPFLPNSRVGMYSKNIVNRETGDNIEYEAIWYSKSAVPLKSIVDHKGTRFVVQYSTDYTDYSNINVYYLSAEENQQSELKLRGESINEN